MWYSPSTWIFGTVRTPTTSRVAAPQRAADPISCLHALPSVRSCSGVKESLAPYRNETVLVTNVWDTPYLARHCHSHVVLLARLALLLTSQPRPDQSPFNFTGESFEISKQTTTRSDRKCYFRERKWLALRVREREPELKRFWKRELS